MNRKQLMLLGISAVAAIPALAQESKVTPTTGAAYNNAMAQTDVGERNFEQYTADGARFGDFKVFPKLELTEEFTDNVYAVADDRRSDYLTIVSPSVNIKSDLPRHEIDLSAVADFTEYARYSGEDTAHVNVTGQGKLDVSREDWFTLSATYDHGYEPRSSPDPSQGKTPTPVDNTSVKLAQVYRPGRLWVTVDGQYQRLDYGDVYTSTDSVLAYHLRDRDIYSGGVRVAYELMPGYFAFVESRANDRIYDSLSAVGQNRDSHGFEERVGATFELTGKLRGDIFAGYLVQNFKSPTFSSVTGAAFGAGLTWNATALTTVTLQAQRTVEDTIDSGASSYVASMAHLTVAHELRRNIVLSLDGGLDVNEYQGDGTLQHVYDGGTKIAYKLNKFAYLGGVYHYYKRYSTLESEAYSENRLMVTLGLQY